jgi:hypothetical protein
MAAASIAFRAFLLGQYEKFFGRPWPVLGSALGIASLNVFLFAFDRPWTASDGMRNWGDQLFRFTGVLDQPDLLPPLLYSGSVLNLGVLFGACASALLSREFVMRTAPGRELVKGASGGILMGCGAVLAFGCNVGGFFSALSALSASGVAMMAGLAAGAFLGVKYLAWEGRRFSENDSAPSESPCLPSQAAAGSFWTGAQPLAGLIVFGALLGGAYLYRRLGYSPLAVFLLFGAAFGVVFQRSRFCLVRAFREPFLSGESDHARAAALALTLGMIGFAILKATDLKDAMDWVFPAFWGGALSGGVLFGVGMVIAGACGAGTLWRAGEGQVKLWVALFFFAFGTSMMRLLLSRLELLRQLGSAVFLPDVFGWGGAVWSVVALMVFWYLWAGWNEERGHLAQAASR